MTHKFYLTALSICFSVSALAQTGSWQLWGSGLPQGSFPKMAVAPDHSVYYTLVGTGGTKGIVNKADGTKPTGTFTALPAIPLPASIQNNVQGIIVNSNNELIAGVMRNNVNEPFSFVFDKTSQTWVASNLSANSSKPTLGTYCMTKSPDGTMWIGAKWANVYKSTDGGRTFTGIDESAVIKAAYPCYYPSYGGVDYDAAIYGINVDGNGRLYVGTESAGVVFSDDNGTTWKPADLHPCMDNDNTQKDTLSSLKPLAMGGNVAGLGFTIDNKLVFTGGPLWKMNWKTGMALVDMNAKTVQPLKGMPDYLVQQGQQVSKIVTTANGRMFFHSGSSNGAQAADIGIYTSTDGLNWKQFNTGITGQNDGQSQGGLAVDGNLVYFATHDGKVWRYDAAAGSNGISSISDSESISLVPNPASEQFQLDFGSVTDRDIIITNSIGGVVLKMSSSEGLVNIDTKDLANGIYLVSIRSENSIIVKRVMISHAD